MKHPESPNWRTPSTAVQLDPDRVHLWRADLRGLREHLDDYLALLDGADLARLDQIRHETTHREFVLSHGILRCVLGLYLSVWPEQIRFGRRQYGKPFVESPWRSGLEFNLSHSRQRMLLAISPEPVGVDLEPVTDGRDCLGLAERFFAPAEFEQVRAQSRHEAPQAFTKIWVRKEAFVKGVGKGLHMGLKSFVVSADPAEPHVQLDPACKAGDAQITVPMVQPWEGFFAAVAMPDRLRLACFEWNHSLCRMH